VVNVSNQNGNPPFDKLRASGIDASFSENLTALGRKEGVVQDFQTGF
jgi:hypothetical protein